jgi:hypothetical protein
VQIFTSPKAMPALPYTNNPEWRGLGYNARWPTLGHNPKWQDFGYSPRWDGFQPSRHIVAMPVPGLSETCRSARGDERLRAPGPGPGSVSDASVPASVLEHNAQKP